MVTEAELHLLAWQFRTKMGHFAGSFYTALWDAMARADSTNLYRLALGFADDVAAYQGFANKDGYFQDVVSRWNAQGGTQLEVD